MSNARAAEGFSSPSTQSWASFDAVVESIRALNEAGDLDDLIARARSELELGPGADPNEFVSLLRYGRREV